VPTALGAEVGTLLEVDEGLQPIVGNEDHITTPSTVAAGRAASWHKLLTSEGDDAIATVARFHEYSSFIKEHARNSKRLST